MGTAWEDDTISGGNDAAGSGTAAEKEVSAAAAMDADETVAGGRGEVRLATEANTTGGGTTDAVFTSIDSSEEDSLEEETRFDEVSDESTPRE